jgi:hypothetical protein
VAGVKQSAILVMLTEPLESVPANELDALRRFLVRRVRGLDEDNHRRWLRFLKRLTSGEVAQFYPVVNRSGPFHARHMTIEGRIFEHQDGFAPTKAGQRAFRNWLKVGASLVSLEIDGAEPRWLPGSCSYPEMSDDEMREFHEAAMDYLRTPHALKKLWPAVKAADRLQMLEAALTNPKDEGAPE